jgi:ATP-dependent DNA helicase RecG
MNEQSEIRNLKGIGAKTEKLFHKMGIFTIGDLLRYYPRGYDVYEEPVSVGELEEGKISTVKGVIYGRVQVGGGKRMQITTAYVKDLTGTLKVIWFRMPFLRNTGNAGYHKRTGSFKKGSADYGASRVIFTTG